MGAGCGRADLITLRGMRLLEGCDAVVYDDLIDLGLLDLAPPDAERRYLGKRCGKHSAPQEDISAALISLAREGKTWREILQWYYLGVSIESWEKT